jgi:3-methyladenine DNA glycosylase AlkD
MDIKFALQNSISIKPDKAKYFFKTNPGQYAEHDQFIGVSVPNLRKIAKDFSHANLLAIQELLNSKINEERMLGLIILETQYKKAPHIIKEKLYNFYLNNLHNVNNWNLVDASAHLIMGAHLFNKNKDFLLELTQSDNLWKRRIAIVATWYFIKKNDFEWTFKIATLLLNDKHDLIHKAVGWMIREAGKKNLSVLLEFLDNYASTMPRVMLRYSIEKLSDEQKKLYLTK